MKRFYLVAIAAGQLLPISGPSLAAKKSHPSTTQGAVKKNRGVLPPSHSSRVLINFPYPDRPYGDPNRWGEISEGASREQAMADVKARWNRIAK